MWQEVLFSMSVQTASPRVSRDDLLESVRLVELPGGLRLPYVEQGDPDGVPVVFLHGITDSWRSFEPVLPYLPDSVHAIALTQRGHGDADRPESGYYPRDFATDLAAFLDSQDLPAAVIVGHSMGSAVALQFAIDYPERTSGLVLLGAFHRFAANAVLTEFRDTALVSLDDPIDPALAREFQESTIAGPIPSAWLETFIAESLKAPARVWRDGFAGLFADEYVERIGEITAPTLLIWGDQDAMATESDQVTLRSLIAGARLEIYRGVGHAVHWDAPERFAADLIRFVGRRLAS
jgi:non-heme chloroperoxidase